MARHNVRSVPFDTAARLDDIIEPEKEKKKGKKKEKEKRTRPRPVALQRASRWG